MPHWPASETSTPGPGTFLPVLSSGDRSRRLWCLSICSLQQDQILYYSSFFLLGNIISLVIRPSLTFQVNELDPLPQSWFAEAYKKRLKSFRNL